VQILLKRTYLVLMFNFIYSARIRSIIVCPKQNHKAAFECERHNWSITRRLHWRQTKRSGKEFKKERQLGRRCDVGIDEDVSYVRYALRWVCRCAVFLTRVSSVTGTNSYVGVQYIRLPIGLMRIRKYLGQYATDRSELTWAWDMG
jgi:hypothetical protein